MLLDLGFAHRPGENTSLLKAGYVLGTANYLAPELSNPAEPADDFAADVYGLGVMLFEMLSGQLPFPAGTLEQTLRWRAAERPRDIAGLVPGLPVSLVSLISRLLSRNPADRPSAGRIVKELIPLEIAALRPRRAA